MFFWLIRTVTQNLSNLLPSSCSSATCKTTGTWGPFWCNFDFCSSIQCKIFISERILMTPIDRSIQINSLLMDQIYVFKFSNWTSAFRRAFQTREPRKFEMIPFALIATNGYSHWILWRHYHTTMLHTTLSNLIDFSSSNSALISLDSLDRDHRCIHLVHTKASEKKLFHRFNGRGISRPWSQVVCFIEKSISVCSFDQ